MEQSKPVLYVTVLLALSAGYCDTLTFVSVDNLFSAHVTGNFIVFAYDILKQADARSWLKLLSFPVFIIAVICGGKISARLPGSFALLTVEGIMLMVSGFLWVIF